MNSSPTTDPPRISEGLLIAGVTLVGYAMAFAHEAGYAGHFGVPLDLVSVDITRILVVTGLMLGLAWLLFSVFNPLSSAFKSKNLPEPLRERLGYLVWPSVLLIGFLHFYGPRRVFVISALVLIVLVLGVEFLLPLVTERKTSGYWAKVAAANAGGNRPPESPSPLLLPIVRIMGRERFILLPWIAFVVYMSYSSGQANAIKSEWFYCPSDSSSAVVVRIYGSTVVGAKYDARSKRLVGELLLGRPGEGPWQDLKWRRVGPLESFAPEVGKIPSRRPR